MDIPHTSRTSMLDTSGAVRFDNDEQRWRAIVDRDARADGQFVYSVRSTGVYCRPSCASRLARRENVAFHASCEAATAAGFRPCKRCRPDEQAAHAAQLAGIAAACRLIEASDSLPALDALAHAAGMSPHHFHRSFKAATGITPRAYAIAVRNRRVQAAVQSAPSITDALYDAGFNSSSPFYANAKQALGMKPANFRQGGTHERIRFALGETSLGALLVAATYKGICSIALGDDPETLLHGFQHRFAGAELVGGDAEFERWVAEVVAFVEMPARGLTLPLDIRGTAFQQRVWQALREIPAGTTLSYSEFAARLGTPNATRAVASACAANTIAIAIPCHRIVRTDGSLSGYRWGVARKRSLIDREKAGNKT